MASSDALLSLVYQAPELDAPRLVYGDWLQQHADPRAELLMLQLKARPSKGEVARAKVLVREFGRSWLGLLGPAIVRRTEQFSRGFPSSGAVSFGSEALRDALTGHPAWNTFTELAGAAPSFLAGTELRGLETLFVTGDEVLPVLRRRRWPFRRLARLSVRWSSSFALASLLDLDVPVLRHLELSPQEGERERLSGALSNLKDFISKLDSLRVTHLRGAAAIGSVLKGPGLQRLELDFPPVVFHRLAAGGWALEVKRAVSGTPRLVALNELLPLVGAIVEPGESWGIDRAQVRADLERLRVSRGLAWALVDQA